MRVAVMGEDYQIEGESEAGEILPVDPEMVATMAAAALEANSEADWIKGLLERPYRFFRVLVVNEEREEGPWFDFYLATTPEELARMKRRATERFGPEVEVPERIYVGSWPLRACLPNQN